MNKLLTKIAGVALGLTMAIGVGVATGAKIKKDVEVKAADVTDTLVASSFKATSTTYTDFSGVKFSSSAVYAGNNGKTSSGGIQLRSKNSNSGIVTTASGGTLKSISITVESGSKTLDVYGKTTAYSSASDLYNSSTQGTKIGSASSTGTITLTNPSDYTYVGLRSNNGALYLTSIVITWNNGSTGTTYSVTYNANGATSGSVPTDSNQYENNATVTVLGNTGTLAKTGYVWSGWNTADDGSGTDRAAGATFSISADTTLYAKWTADTLNSLSISGSMTKTSYKVGDSWNPAGFTVTANYQSGATPDVTNYVTWSYYVGGAAQATAAEGDTSVVVRATYGGKYVESSAQTISVTAGVTYDLSNISGFSSWTNSYTTHTVTHSDVGASVSATMNFSITNKQSSGVGSAYPCIGAKTNSELECLTFTLTQSGKKIASVDIVFVTRYTSTFPTLYLHKGSGIATTALETLTMSGAQASEHTLSVANLNDTVFTVGYNAHQTGSNGAVGIKSISIGLADQASFGTLDHISVTGLPNVVYHVGETYDPTGFAVTAFDGADESTANFKDVTASVVQLLDDTYTFLDSDVPGFDEEVEYTEGGKTVSDTYHVYVYALAEYELVTSEPADWSGNYLIVGTNYNSDLVAMNGGLANPDVPDGYKVVTDSSNIIEAGQELEWTIASYSSGYSIQGKGGKYIGSLTSKTNGMLVSETALVNTLSIENGAVTISGTNSYCLKIYNESSSSRFRYYTSGTVQLYKLVESDNADAYAQTFLGAFTCDATGEKEPTFAIKEGSTYWSWSLLATEYDTLTSVEKEQFRLGVASETGSNIEQALARYDYIVAKYGTSKYSNFMNRTITPLSSSGIVLNNVLGDNGATAIIVVISLVSVTAIGGYFFIKKKEQ